MPAISARSNQFLPRNQNFFIVPFFKCQFPHKSVNSGVWACFFAAHQKKKTVDLTICRYGPDVLSLEPFSATFAGRKELNFIVCLLGTGQIWLELQTLIPRST